MIRYVRAIGIALLAAAAACWLALQRPAPFNLAIGGAIVRDVTGAPVAPLYDLPFLRGVHGAEPAEIVTDTRQTYRWTEPESSINAPNLNGGAMVARLRLATPPAPVTPLAITLNGANLRADLPPGPRTLLLFAPPTSDGSIDLALDAPLYTAPPDERGLGVTLYQFEAQPARESVGWRPFAPWPLLGAAVGILLCVGLGAACAGVGPRASGGAILVGGAGLALLLAAARPVVTIAAVRLLGASAAGLATVLAGSGLAWLLGRTAPAERREVAWIAGLTGLGFALRLIGLRHPQANFSDLMLNVNNLTGAARGDLIITEGLTCEAGAGNSPYPPGVYVALQPLLLLFGDPSQHAVAVQIGGALLDALVIPLIWWAVRAVRADGAQMAPAGRMALWSAALYLVPLEPLKSLIVGEYTNVGGQALAMPAVLGVSAWVGCGMPRRWRPAVLAALTVAALVHSGVLISVGIWGAAWFAIELWRRRPAAGQLLLLGGLAVAIAGAIYYSNFIGDPTLASNNPDCPILRPVGAKLLGVLKGLLTFDGRLPIWFWLVGLSGALLARRRLPELAAPLWAWLATIPLSQVSLLWSEQTVRWWLFATPALCIGGGIGLAALAERRGPFGLRGRWMAIALTLMVLALSLGLWIRFIVRYRTGNFVP